MWAIQINEQGGPEVLAWTEFDDPTPGMWHVLAEETSYQGEYQITVSTFANTGTGPVDVPAMGTRTRATLVGLLLVSALGLGFRPSRSRGGFPRR